MSTQEIIAEIDKLTPKERQEILARLGNFERSAATSLAELARSEGVQEENICDVLARFAGTAEGLPEDMAVNHDHYLYGVPKQKP